MDKYKMKAAQAQSDKVELMRDIATYEAGMSDSVNLRKTLMGIYDIVTQTKAKVEETDKEKERMDQLLTKVENGIQEIELKKQ